MKTLLILRHAKAERENPLIRDFERRLTAEGEQEAEQMGRELVQRAIIPEQIVSSAAVRAKETVAALLQAAQLNPETRFDERLYGAASIELLRVVRNLANQSNIALIVGHNPGMEGLASRLTGTVVNMPTAALVCVEFDLSDWQDIDDNRGQLKWLATPINR